MIIYSASSGTRTVEMDLTSVSAWFKPYIGWVGDANGQTFTIESRASFDNGSTWTSYVTNSNNDELTDAFDEDTKSHADIVEVKYSLSTTNNEESPWIDQLFIYFPDFDPYLETTIPMITGSIDSYLHVFFDTSSLPLMSLDIIRDMAEYSHSGNIEGSFDFSFEGALGGSIYGELPEIDSVFSGDCGAVSVLTENVPVFSLGMYSGGTIVNTLPLVDLQTLIQTNYLFNIDLILHQFTFNTNTFVSPTGSFISTLPWITYQSDIIQGMLADIITQLPKPFLESSGYVGTMSDIQAALKSFRFRTTSYPTGPNEFDSLLLSVVCKIHSGEIDFDVLRFVDRRIR